MHSKFARLMTMLALLICLPLQGLAAVTMLSCPAHDPQPQMQAEMGDMADMSGCEEHHQGADQQSHKSPCDKCFACYLSVAQALVPAVAALKLQGGSPMVAAQTGAIPDPAPSSPFHPPRPIPA